MGKLEKENKKWPRAVRDLGFLQDDIDFENLNYILLNEQVWDFFYFA